MWACGFFVARVPGATRPELSGTSVLFVVLFALPSYAVLWRWAGPRRALQVLAGLGLFALGIETLAVATGWPYGRFSYGDAIGGKVAGLVPWSVPFAWTPLVLGTHALTQRLLRFARPISGSRRTSPGEGTAWPGLSVRLAPVAAGAVALAVADLVLDPGAVRQKFWHYDAGGPYYGVPASNYFGWLLSGLVGHVLLRLLLRPGGQGEPNPGHSPGVAAASPLEASPLEAGAQPPAGLAVSLGWTLAFWCSVCAWGGLWAPAAIGHCCLLLLWIALRPAARGAGIRDGSGANNS